jgi:hypothetical protein
MSIAVARRDPQRNSFTRKLHGHVRKQLVIEFAFKAAFGDNRMGGVGLGKIFAIDAGFCGDNSSRTLDENFFDF